MFYSKKIKFISKQSQEILHPVPVRKAIPEWFKKMPNYSVEGVEKVFNSTVKKCVPFLDTFLCGYAILNPIETMFWKDGEQVKWSAHKNVDVGDLNLGFGTHGLDQVSPDQVMKDEEPHPFKWLNPWRIKTPKNYSCLFTNPLNRGSVEQPIRVVDGIVDTDDYPFEINFPFFIKKLSSNKTTIIPKGYPIVLVFPFPRESWKMSVEEVKETPSKLKFNSLLEDLYKTFYWRKKRYD